MVTLPQPIQNSPIASDNYPLDFEQNISGPPEVAVMFYCAHYGLLTTWQTVSEGPIPSAPTPGANQIEFLDLRTSPYGCKMKKRRESASQKRFRQGRHCNRDLACCEVRALLLKACRYPNFRLVRHLFEAIASQI